MQSSPSAETKPNADTKPSADTKPKADAKAKADTKKSPAEMRKASNLYLKLCLQDWDSATHMTRKEWDRTCRRVARDRANFMPGQMDK